MQSRLWMQPLILFRSTRSLSNMSIPCVPCKILSHSFSLSHLPFICFEVWIKPSRAQCQIVSLYSICLINANFPTFRLSNLLPCVRAISQARLVGSVQTCCAFLFRSLSSSSEKPLLFAVISSDSCSAFHYSPCVCSLPFVFSRVCGEFFASLFIELTLWQLAFCVHLHHLVWIFLASLYCEAMTARIHLAITLRWQRNLSRCWRSNAWFLHQARLRPLVLARSRTSSELPVLVIKWQFARKTEIESMSWQHERIFGPKRARSGFLLPCLKKYFFGRIPG